MTPRTLPPKDKLTICFAHVAYRMAERFALRNTGIKSFEVRSPEELEARIGDADVLLLSGLWRNDLIAKAFDMRVIGTKRDPSRGKGAADAVVATDKMLGVLPEADFVALTCPLTPQTEKLIDARALVAIKPSAFLINVARGRVVDEPA